MRGRRTLTLLLLAFIACAKTGEAPPPPEPPPTKVAPAPVTTDRTRYVMREGPFAPETTIVATFTAPADKPVYIVNCNGAIGVGLQRLVGEEWQHAWSVEMNACLSEPIVIPAGGRRTETIRVESGVDAFVSSRRTETKVGTGTYRAVFYGVLTSFDFNARPFGPELPLEQRASAPFVIEAPVVRDPSRPSPVERPAEIASAEPAHASDAGAKVPIRIRFTDALRDGEPPYLYVDDDPVDATLRGLEFTFLPRGGWKPGRHEVRVIYRNDAGETLWYAWYFTVLLSR